MPIVVRAREFRPVQPERRSVTPDRWVDLDAPAVYPAGQVASGNARRPQHCDGVRAPDAVMTIDDDAVRGWQILDLTRQRAEGNEPRAREPSVRVLVWLTDIDEQRRAVGLDEPREVPRFDLRQRRLRCRAKLREVSAGMRRRWASSPARLPRSALREI